MIFMLIYYHAAGINADLALILNLVILLGFLGFSGATLTLPGIAGVILTVGMGVDSNVLIFERIREELRHGKTPSSAVDQGFAHAWTTIFDTHVTTIVSAVILFLFGTGPVRGFAVTLSVGLAGQPVHRGLRFTRDFRSRSQPPSAWRSIEHLIVIFAVPAGVFNTEARRTRRGLDLAGDGTTVAELGVLDRGNCSKRTSPATSLQRRWMCIGNLGPDCWNRLSSQPVSRVGITRHSISFASGVACRVQGSPAGLRLPYRFGSRQPGFGRTQVG